MNFLANLEVENPRVSMAMELGSRYTITSTVKRTLVSSVIEAITQVTKGVARIVRGRCDGITQIAKVDLDIEILTRSLKLRDNAPHDALRSCATI